jgi:hypothetical protein
MQKKKMAAINAILKPNTKNKIISTIMKKPLAAAIGCISTQSLSLCVVNDLLSPLS